MVFVVCRDPPSGSFFSSTCLVIEAVKHHSVLCLFLRLPVSQRSKISLGGKALSHDSVFVSDSSEANEALGASQDSIHGKVKSLQVCTHKRSYRIKDKHVKVKVLSGLVHQRPPTP